MWLHRGSKQASDRFDDSTLLLDDPRQRLLLMHCSAVPFASHWLCELRLVLSDTRVRVWQILDEEFGRFAFGPLGDDDVGSGCVFSRRRFDAGRLDQEAGIGSSLADTLASPRALNV